MKRFHTYLCALAAASMLSGCITTHRTAADGSPIAIQPHNYSQSVDISGRFTAQFERNDRPESWSGSFTWNQTPQATAVALQSPLGQTLAMISIDENGYATLKQSDQPPRSAENVDALVATTLGWPLPVSNLRDWLQAYAIDSGGQRILVTPQSNAAVATLDGWHINYNSWQDDDDVGMQGVPKRIDMERDTTQAGKVQMRLVITSWQTH